MFNMLFVKCLVGCLMEIAYNDQNCKLDVYGESDEFLRIFVSLQFDRALARILWILRVFVQLGMLHFIEKVWRFDPNIISIVLDLLKIAMMKNLLMLQ